MQSSVLLVVACRFDTIVDIALCSSASLDGIKLYRENDWVLINLLIIQTWIDWDNHWFDNVNPCWSTDTECFCTNSRWEIDSCSRSAFHIRLSGNLQEWETYPRALARNQSGCGVHWLKNSELIELICDQMDDYESDRSATILNFDPEIDAVFHTASVDTRMIDRKSLWIEVPRAWIALDSSLRTLVLFVVTDKKRSQPKAQAKYRIKSLVPGRIHSSE